MVDISKLLDLSEEAMYNKEKRMRGGLTIKFDNSIYNPITSDSSSRMKVVYIKLDKLKPFANHPFKLYEGQQLEALIHSIKETDIHEPILIRKINDGNYEILSGHNRVYAASKIGLEDVPCVLCEPENDEEAQVIVVESNFNQRSKKDMKHSEFANALYMLNEAMKKRPGYRSDLQESEDGSQSDNRLRTMHVIGDKYGLSQATIARYIRVAQLSKELQECLDNKLIGLGVAEHLSYLRTSEQDIVQRLLNGKVKIDAQQAKELKQQSSDHELSEDEIRQIIIPKLPTLRRRSIKLGEDLFSKYFTEDQSLEDIEKTIEKALDLLRSQNPS